MNLETMIAWTAIPQAESTIAFVAIWGPEPLLDNVIWNRFPRERKEV